MVWIRPYNQLVDTPETQLVDRPAARSIQPSPGGRYDHLSAQIRSVFSATTTARLPLPCQLRRHPLFRFERW